MKGDVKRGAGEEQEREGDAERGAGEEQEREGDTEGGADEEQEREGEGTEQEEGRRNPAKRSIGRDTEMPTETGERRDWSRHVPGGAWLTQVRSCLWGKFLTRWNSSGSGRGTQGRDREEGLGERKFVSACTYH
ncbi:hypothetical protein NDU88_005020 [Pleurodeles waltl]|uniref:Uncharacterized protein n=1 Tax=Pleurodeles waltl TaxID=8319 RepID=A0AAV7VLG4_PLEWA|nr:hypothetical protein NDU88_005020 [Pleurodeles waltl]